MFTPEDGIGEEREFTPIPANTKVPAILHIEEVKQSKGGHWMHKMALTVSRGQYKGRKVFNYQLLPMQKEMHPTANEISKVAYTRILEAAEVFNPDKPETYNVFNSCGSVQEFAQKVAAAIEGAEVAVRLGIEEGDGGFGPRNKINEWYTPNPKSHGHKGWQEVMSNGGASDPNPNPAASTQSAPDSLTNDPATPAGAPAWLS